MRRNKGISTGTGIIILIILGVGAYGAYTYFSLINVLNEIDLELSNVDIEDYTLLPPSIDLVFIYRANNPSNLRCEMTCQFDLYLGNTYLTSYHAESQVLNPNTWTPIRMETSFSGNILLGLITNLDKFYDENQYVTTGFLSITHKMFGLIPVTVNINI